jgi:hypothetical protein
MTSQITPQQIIEALKTNQISVSELRDIANNFDEINTKHTVKTSTIEKSKVTDEFVFNAETILSFVGGGILLLGLFVLLSSNWSSFNSTGQVMLTLGTGIFVGLSSLFIQPILKKTYILNITQFIAGILLTTGVTVLINNTNPNVADEIVASACFGFLALIYATFDKQYNKGVLTFGWLGFATLSYAFLVGYLLNNQWSNLNQFRAGYIAVVLISLFYMLVAKLIWNTKKYFFKSLILNMGAVGLMVGLFNSVQKYIKSDFDQYNPLPDGWQGSVILEHVYGLIFVGFYYLAEKTKSKVLLLSTSIGLFAWLMYMINVRYNLSNNLGISLMISGLVLMAIGYQTYAISKRFQKQKRLTV